jgi:hypothetical protein
LRRGDAWVRDDIAGATEYVRVWEIDGRRLIDLPSLTPTADQPIALLIGGCHLPPRVFQKISDCILHHAQYGMNAIRKLSVRSLSLPCSLGLSATSTFLSEQTSHQQPASSTFLSEQTSTRHQSNEQAACRYILLVAEINQEWMQWIQAGSDDRLANQSKHSPKNDKH